MAEMNTNPSNSHQKSKRIRLSKKLSTRVDMTPIVDLGFLLITFFIFTTTLNENVVLAVQKPPSAQGGHPVPGSRTLTLILGKSDRIYWYMGVTDPGGKRTPVVNITDYSEDGLKKVLTNQDHEIRMSNGYTNPKMLNYDSNGVIVIIKPLNESNYKNIVDVLDEMNSAKITTFSWAEVNASDLALVEREVLGR